MTTVRIDPRFSTFLAGQQTDPQARNRLLTSAMAATVALGAAAAFGWTADKLGVRTVEPPTHQYAIMIDLGPPPPPAAKPPPPPEVKGVVTAAPVDPKRAVVQPPRATPDVAPSEVGDPDPAGDVVGVPPRPPGLLGPPGPLGPPMSLVPGCANPPCGSARMPGIGDRTTPRTAPDRAHQPVSVVKANAIFAPDPDQHRLSRTKSGVMRRGGKAQTSVSFCVSPTGAVTDIKTTRGYPGDAEVDRICREAVAKWRFKPFIVDGKPRQTCTTTTFAIEFE